MTSNLRCASCGRSESDFEGAQAFAYEGVKWCPICADIKQTPKGSFFVALPSPGRMCEGAYKEDPLSAWGDCYLKKAKKRILISRAKTEIQRAWNLWKEDKYGTEAMFTFFCWITRYRPYFLTFRYKGDDRWQAVNAWLIQHENAKSKNGNE